MRQIDVEKVLAGTSLTLDILLVDVPPILANLEGDKVLLIEGVKYFKASSYLEVEKACEHAGADLKDASLKVFAMPYMSLSCCSSLEDLMVEDGGNCCGVTIEIENFQFVQRQSKILRNHFSPLLEDSLEICGELGKFLARVPIPSKTAIECLLSAKAAAEQRLHKARDRNDELHAAEELSKILRLEIDLKLETALYNAQEKHLDTLQKAIGSLELLNEELNSLCADYNILGDVEKCDPGEGNDLSNKFYLDTKNISDGSPREKRSLKNCRPSVDNLRRSLFPQLDDVPDLLRHTSDHLVIEVHGTHWIRVSDFSEFECLCEKGSSDSAKYVLNIVVMPYMSLKDCAKLVDCYGGNSAKCHRMQFQIKNLDFTMERATVLDCHVQKLITQNSEAVDIFQKGLLLSKFEHDKMLKMLLAERDSATEELISSMLNEGLDIHATLLKLKPEIHYQLYVEDGGFDPCEDADSQIGLSCFDTLSRIETYKNALAARRPQIGSVDEQRTRLVR